MYIKFIVPIILFINNIIYLKNSAFIFFTVLSAAILSITGILDIVSLELNGETSNIVLNEYEIPVMGELTDE